MLNNLPDIVTIKELANFLKVSEVTIRRALISDNLKGFKVARDWRISKEAVTQWLSKKKK